MFCVNALISQCSCHFQRLLVVSALFSICLFLCVINQAINCLPCSLDRSFYIHSLTPGDLHVKMLKLQLRF